MFDKNIQLSVKTVTQSFHVHLLDGTINVEYTASTPSSYTHAKLVLVHVRACACASTSIGSPHSAERLPDAEVHHIGVASFQDIESSGSTHGVCNAYFASSKEKRNFSKLFMTEEIALEF